MNDKKPTLGDLDPGDIALLFLFLGFLLGLAFSGLLLNLIGALP